MSGRDTFGKLGALLGVILGVVLTVVIVNSGLIEKNENTGMIIGAILGAGGAVAGGVLGENWSAKKKTGNQE